MFKAIANSGSHATSVQEAEKYALKYYWYFMFVTAFVFTGLADAAMKIWNNRLVPLWLGQIAIHIQNSPPLSIPLNSFDDVDESIEDLVKKIAAQTPLTTAATWLNWIIVRTTSKFNIDSDTFALTNLSSVLLLTFFFSDTPPPIFASGQHFHL